MSPVHEQLRRKGLRTCRGLLAVFTTTCLSGTFFFVNANVSYAEELGGAQTEQVISPADQDEQAVPDADDSGEVVTENEATGSDSDTSKQQPDDSPSEDAEGQPDLDDTDDTTEDTLPVVCSTKQDYAEKLGCPRPTVTNVENAIFDSHIVTDDVVDPSGTTTNLFDYWWDGENTSDAQYKAIDGKYPYWDGAINKGHQLHFNREAHKNESYPYSLYSYKLHNSWMATKGDISYGPHRPGMIKNKLVNEYPELQADTSNNHEVTGIEKDESLAYLFNLEPNDGKRSYAGVKGLFRLVNGYYTYDSQTNFASYDVNANRFRLYDSFAVNTRQNTPAGQFFPFNTANEVFDAGTVNNQTLTRRTVRADDPMLNHYFGLTMSTRFVQKNGGRTIDGKNAPVTYEFSGDDDVWVYIDDVLVGDLGGLHDAVSLKIDFSTGDVSTVVQNKDGEPIESTRTSSTLRELFNAARANKDTTWSDANNTFGDDTYHTLKFFYMERGWGDSDMSLRFNLVTMPESGIVKIDQDGNPIAGAGFTLYAAEKSKDGAYTKKTAEDGADIIAASGTTNANGELELMNPETHQWVFMDTIAERYGEYYILEETKVPDGYRRSGDMHLQYVRNSDSDIGTTTDSGILVSDPSTSKADGNAWDTGSLALAEVKVSAPSESDLQYTDKKGVAQHLTAEQVKNGTMFAVVFQKDKDGNWRGIYGDQVGGWHTTEAEPTGGNTGMKAVLDAFAKDPHVFHLSSSGSYETLLENLPGDIRDYYCWSGKDNARYAVAYYWSSAANTGDNPVKAENTYLLDNTNATSSDTAVAAFKRLFGVKLYVANIRNTVSVQKVDEEGNPLNGAEFAIYRNASKGNSSIACDAMSAAMVKENCEQFDTLTTADHTSGDKNGAGVTEPKFNGSGTFPNTARKQLTNGTYCVIETEAPAGYELNTSVTEVVVNDSGVFVNAGIANDGVTVARGVGTLVKTMSTYGTQGEVDSTLTWLKSVPGVFDAVPEWNNAGGAEEKAREVGVKALRVSDNGSLTSTGTYDGTNPLRVAYGTYGEGSAALEYAPRDTHNLALMFATDTGWHFPPNRTPRLTVM